VEDVQTVAAVGLPVVHGLPRDQGEAFVDGELGDLAVLDAVRPSPEGLAVAEALEVGGLGLGQQDNVAVGDDLFTVGQGDEGFEVGVGDAEAQIGVDAVEVGGVDRQAPLVGLARGGQDAEAQQCGCAGRGAGGREIRLAHA
jgi:hypothetical protein